MEYTRFGFKYRGYVLRFQVKDEFIRKYSVKITEKDSLIDYCTDKIMNADRIVNEGRISGCLKGGNYLFVYKGKELFVINSAT